MRLVVARVGKPHGIRGELTVDVRTDSPDERFVPGAVLHVVRPSPRRGVAPGPDLGLVPPVLTVIAARVHNGTQLLRFDEVPDRNAAERLHGVLLEAEIVEDGTADEQDAWYPAQLIGLRVESPTGAPLGEVVSLDPGSAQDLLGVRCLDGERRLVPFVTALVPVVDVSAGRIVVDAPPGLLDDESD